MHGLFFLLNFQSIHSSGILYSISNQTLPLYALIFKCLGYVFLDTFGIGSVDIFNSIYSNFSKNNVIVVLPLGLWNIEPSLCVGVSIGQLRSNLTSSPLVVVVSSSKTMDHGDILEIRRTLRRHEESIQCNRTLLFSVTSKVHENEHQCATQNVIVIIFWSNKGINYMFYKHIVVC